jgi:hypothetical protein
VPGYFQRLSVHLKLITITHHTFNSHNLNNITAYITMAALSLTLLTLLTLLTSTIALPTTNTVRQVSPEQWSIPRMQMHMMSKDTGIPGNQWPESAKFNSTIDFDILVPDHASTGMVKVNCQAGFANYTLPVGTVECTPVVAEGQSLEAFGSVEFGMSLYTALGPRRPELSFVLSVMRESSDS